MWHEQLFNILFIINNIVLTLIGIPFTLQIFYMLFMWIKKKTYKKTEHKNRIFILIPAHNEEDVIFDTVKEIFEKQKYPMDLVDVYVVAHNCTDKTAELAKKAGAIVIDYKDPDPSHAMARFSIKYGMEYVKNCGKEYDFCIRLDADNRLNDEFLSLMNDCYNSGVEMARPYESATNITQNNFTKACGLYYCYDSRISSRVRERFGIDAHVNGPGSMISMNIIKKHGYDAFGICDDAEFTNLRMLDGYRLHFVEDAIVYEDLTATFKDTLNRNRRMGAGVFKLWATKGFKMFGKFFTTFRFSYLEMFFTYFFCVICAILCTWIPLFYIYEVIYLSLAGSGVIETTLNNAQFYMNNLTTQLMVIGIVLLVLFIFMGLLQGFILTMTEYKKLGCKSRKELISGIFIYPCYVVVYVLSFALGVLFKPKKWVKLSRNKVLNKD